MPDATDVDTLQDDIVTLAQKPQSATIDGNTVNQLNVKDKIAATQYVAGEVSKSKAGRGMWFQKTVPPGCG